MLSDRLASKIVRDDTTGCWLFQGCVTSTGYGRVSENGRPDWAHRVYYRALRGAIPAGKVLDHLCRNRRCVNPDHLEPVTDRENTVRGVAPEATRARHKQQTHCKRGHPLFGGNLRRGSDGRRVCIACHSAHAAAYRARIHMPNKRKRAVVTPAGRFASASEAARAHGLAPSVATWRARNRFGGWAYADVLLEIANAPEPPDAR